MKAVFWESITPSFQHANDLFCCHLHFSGDLFLHLVLLPHSSVLCWLSTFNPELSFKLLMLFWLATTFIHFCFDLLSQKGHNLPNWRVRWHKVVVSGVDDDDDVDVLRQLVINKTKRHFIESGSGPGERDREMNTTDSKLQPLISWQAQGKKAIHQSCKQFSCVVQRIHFQEPTLAVSFPLSFSSFLFNTNCRRATHQPKDKESRPCNSQQTAVVDITQVKNVPHWRTFGINSTTLTNKNVHFEITHWAQTCNNAYDSHLAVFSIRFVSK